MIKKNPYKNRYYQKQTQKRRPKMSVLKWHNSRKIHVFTNEAKKEATVSKQTKVFKRTYTLRNVFSNARTSSNSLTPNFWKTKIKKL